MNPWDPPALVYAALQRFYVLEDPASAEKAWQQRHRFDALPKELKTPGCWYRYEGEAVFIEYKPDGSGQFHQRLCEGIDPQSVVVIPMGSKIPGLLDRLTGMLRICSPDGLTAQAQLMIDDLTALADSKHAATVARQVSGDAFSLFPSGVAALLEYLDQKLDWMAGEGIGNSKVTGLDVAAMFLMNSVAHQITSGSEAPPLALLYKMFDSSGVPSLAEMIARSIRDCFAHGLGEKAIAAIKEVRKGADGTLKVARERIPEWQHPGVDLDRYYNALHQAGIRFLAARWGYQSANVVGSLSAADRAEFDKRVNTAEEKLVRVATALFYAITDLDGTRLREKQGLIRELRAAGKANEVDRVLGDLIDSQLFYPPYLRNILVGEAV